MISNDIKATKDRCGVKTSRVLNRQTLNRSVMNVFNRYVNKQKRASLFGLLTQKLGHAFTFAHFGLCGCGFVLLNVQYFRASPLPPSPFSPPMSLCLLHLSCQAVRPTRIHLCLINSWWYLFSSHNTFQQQQIQLQFCIMELWTHSLIEILMCWSVEQRVLMRARDFRAVVVIKRSCLSGESF